MLDSPSGSVMETSRNPGLPPLFRRHVRRPRLTRPLDESAAQTLLFTAPAGYGKTALAAEWLETTPHVAWYRATGGSADVAAVSVGIADAVAHFMPGAGDRLRRRVRMGDAPEKMVRALAELLAEDLSEWPSGAWLVIDDYHLVRPSKAADEFVDWLLMLTPIRLLATTRQRPRWATARRLLQGEIVELTKDQLAMTTAEANEVLSSRPPASVRALVEKAEGWPVLVALGAVSGPSLPLRPNVLPTLFQYFAEEVMQDESDGIQRLLAVVSLPPTFDAVFTHEVAGVEDPAAVLQHLLSRGLIESTLEEFRLHPLLREFLTGRLRQTLSRSELQTVLDCALAHARSRGRLEEAFDIALRADLLDTATTIAAEAAPELLVAGRLETLAGWLASLGARAEDAPSLALAKADLLTRLGDLPQAVAVSEQVGASVQPTSEHASRAWCLASRAHHLLSNPQRALETSVRAREVALTSSDEYEAYWRSLCAAKELALPDHERYFCEFERVAGTSVDAHVRIACGQISLAASRGSLAGLWQDLTPLLTRLHAVSDPMVALGSLVAFIDLALARADYSSALTLSRRGLALAQANRVAIAIGPFIAGQAQASIGLRRLGQAQALVAELHMIAKRDGDPYTMLSHRIAAARLGIMQRTSTIAHIDSKELDLIPNLRVYVASYLGLTSLIAATSDPPRMALERSEQAVAIASTGETRAYSDLARLIVDTRRRPSSSQVRRRGVALFARFREAELLDPLVLAYRVYPPILSHLVANDDGVLSFARELLVASHDTKLAGEVGISLVKVDGVEQLLTRRELEVMNLVVQGCTNAEIAYRLVITHSTAKVHVHNILKKLGARTRIELALTYRATGGA